MTCQQLITGIRSAVERSIDAATTLFAVHHYAASAEMIWLAIETLAGYVAGSRARTPSKAIVLAFAEAWLTELGGTSPGPVALADRPRRPVASVAEILYECFHGGLFHDGQRPAGVHCLDDKGKWLVRIEPGGLVTLNVLPLHCQLERAMTQYLARLPRDSALAAKAQARSAFLASPTLVPRRD